MSSEETLSPRETYIFTLQELSSFDWEEIIDTNDKREEFIKDYLNLANTIIEAIYNIKTKKLSQFVASALPSLLKSLDFVSWSLLNEDTQDPSADQARKIVDLLLTFIDSLSSRLPDNSSNLELCQTSKEETSRLHYLLVYILLQISEKYLGPTPFYFALQYHMNNAPKYYTYDPPSVEVDENSRLRLLRILNLVNKIQLSLESLLVDSMNTTETEEVSSDNDEPPLILSKKGIAILFASFFGIQNNPMFEKSPSFPSIAFNMAPDQTYKYLIEYGVLLLSSPEEKYQALYDKGLMILFHLVANTKSEAISCDLLDDIFPIFHSSIMQVTQIIASFASLSPDARARFLAYRILSKHLFTMTSDLRAIILTELLSNCPFDTMKSAAINLLKESVEQDFCSGKALLFNSPALFHQFLPMILSRIVEHEGTFQESLHHIVYGGNFYLYLLIRDEENQTGVRSESNIQYIRNKYLDPLAIEVQQFIAESSGISPTPRTSFTMNIANWHFDTPLPLM
ncbi:hypothetical protein K7432_002806 [Basidiobolus ranarum]|uniref:Uncharacterized protein n=1 Tax=Basidiobolus ranarum TaxID=34480 RepID=A0ABR2W7Q4_9FUNG